MAIPAQIEWYDCEGWISASIEQLQDGTYHLVIWDVTEKTLYEKTYTKHKSARIALGRFDRSAYRIRGPIDKKERRALYDRWMAKELGDCNL